MKFGTLKIRWLIGQDYTEKDIEQYVNEDDSETVANAQQSLGYFIAYKDLFSTWISLGSDFSIDNVRTALSSFSRLISPSHKRTTAHIIRYKGILYDITRVDVFEGYKVKRDA